MWWALLLSLASAADEADEDAPREEVMVVYGERLAQAWRSLDQAMAQRDYRRRRRDGRTVYRPPLGKRWKPAVVVYDEGWLVFREPPLVVERPRLVATVLDGLGAGVQEPEQVVGVSASVQAPSAAKRQRQKELLLAALEPSVGEIRAVREAMAGEEALALLPDRLDRLWSLGEPLEGEGRLVDSTARREALLAWWASRACTGQGQRARDAARVFVEQVVQGSGAPVSAEEAGAWPSPCEDTDILGAPAARARQP